MKVLNYGSLNLDYVYSVDHIILGGETEATFSLHTFPGGKGLNQSIALARAGVPVWHAGMVGEEGALLLETCREAGVNTECIAQIEGKSGHTIIQVDRNGQNSILLFGGANISQTREHIDSVLEHFGNGDMILLQNEINELSYIIDRASAKGMQVALNPSPFNEALDSCDLTKVSIFFINEIEGAQITGGEKNPERILDRMKEKYPGARTVLTLGGDGCIYQEGNLRIRQPIFRVPVVDTTAAGDTFTGFFISSILRGMAPAEGLELASKASSIAVSRAGAAPSIPTLEEVQSAE
jgi:ribokinase